jgi:hypothetical protein
MTVRREIAQSRSETGRVEPGGTEAYLKQYVEGLSGEPARRSSESAIAAEALMDDPG